MGGRLTVEEILRGKKPKKKEKPVPSPPSPGPSLAGDAKKALKKAELKKQPPLTIAEKDELRKLIDDLQRWSAKMGDWCEKVGNPRIGAFMAEHGPMVVSVIVSVAEGARKQLGLSTPKQAGEDDGKGALVSHASLLPDMETIEESDVPPLCTPRISVDSWSQFVLLCISSFRKIHGPLAGAPLTTILLFIAFELFAQERFRNEIAEGFIQKLSGPLGKSLREKLIPLVLGGEDGKGVVGE